MSISTDHQMLANGNPAVAPNETSCRPAFRFQLSRLLIFLPLLVVCVVLFSSPNYRSVPGVRSSPLGGDFLQDWVGGGIIVGSNSEQLYESGYFRSVQHDSSLTGFQWTSESYYPAVYPPFYYLAVSPLSSIEYSRAMILWAVLSAIAMTLAGWMMMNFYPPCRPFFVWMWLGAAFFAPTLYCFNIGHKSMFLMLIVTGTFILLYHKRPWFAGLVFGLIAFKPHLAIVIGLAMLIKGQWKFVLGAFTTLSILITLSVATGTGVCFDYLKVCLGFGDYVQSGGYQLTSAYSLWGVMQLMMPGVSPALVKIVVAGLSCVLIFLVAVVLRGPVNTTSSRFALQYASLVLATILLSPHFYFYDLAMALPALFLIISVAPNCRFSNLKTNWKIERLLTGFAIGMLILAGGFSMVARATGVQPGAVAIFAMIAMIAYVAARYPVQQDLLKAITPGRNS